MEKQTKVIEGEASPTAHGKMKKWLADHGARAVWSIEHHSFTLTGYSVSGEMVILQEFPVGGFCEFRSSGSNKVADGLAFLDDLVDEDAGTDVEYSVQKAIRAEDGPEAGEIISWTPVVGTIKFRGFARQTAQHHADKTGDAVRLVRRRTISRVEEVFTPEDEAGR